MGKVTAVVSGKGGTGKTTTVAAVGSCLAVMGHKVLCVDCDAGLRNLDAALGMADFAVSDFTDVVSGGIALADACAVHPKIDNLYFLSAPAVLTSAELPTDIVGTLSRMAREEFDYVLLDAPAGIGMGFSIAVNDIDAAVIVTTGDIGGIRGAQRAAQELYAMGVDDVSLIVNRADKKKFRRSKMTVDDIIDSVGARLIGLIYEDPSVTLAVNSETALVLYTDKGAAVQFLRTAQRLDGQRPKVPPTSTR